MARPLGTLDPRKRTAILDAARAVFLAEGYHASVDSVAAAAGVSKQTIYSHFGSKDELLRAIVTARSKAITAPLVDLAPNASPAETLTAFGRGFLTTLLQPEVVSLYRLIQSLAGEFPELARTYYDAGPRSNVEQLAAYLDAEQVRGRLALPDARMAAELFVGLLLSHIHLRATLGVARASAAEIDRRVAHAVALFLKAHAAAHEA